MYLFQCEIPVQKDTDHFMEEKRKVSGMQQLLLLQYNSDYKVTAWSRDLESLFLVIYPRIFPLFMKTKYSLPCSQEPVAVPCPENFH
jgi:hypothetical protein